jgi:hypothetical protein
LKIEKTSVDPVEIIEEIFYKMFYFLFHSEEAKEYCGFSQISFFCSEEGLPGWYLWLKEKKGAYRLDLINADTAPQKNRRSAEFSTVELAVQGQFAIRYYPSEEEESFEAYSCFEKLIRFGPLFDTTGTPTFEGRNKIPESHFVVGHINVRANLSKDFLELECFAPEQWEDFRVDGLYLKTPDQKDYEAVVPGGRDRNVPGWALSSFLLDKIIMGFCFSFSVSPLSVLLSSESGFDFYIDKENHVKKMENPNSTQFRLTCGLDLKEEDNSTFREDKDLKLYTQAARKRMDLNKSNIIGLWQQPENINNPWINSDWWKVKEMKFREDDSNVCYHDH